MSYLEGFVPSPEHETFRRPRGLLKVRAKQETFRRPRGLLRVVAGLDKENIRVFYEKFMKKENNNLARILSVGTYGFDLAELSGKVFSGTEARQTDYAAFMQKYIVLIPAKKRADDGKKVKIRDNFFVYLIYGRNTACYLRRVYSAAKRLVREENINGLMCDNPFTSALVGVALKKKFGLPLLIHSMAEMIDNHYYLREQKINYLKNIIARRNIKYADIIRVSTRTEIENWRRRRNDGNKLFNAPFYIDFAPFVAVSPNQELRRRLLGKSYDRIALYVGRFAKQKDLLTLVRAIREAVKDNYKTHFVLLGDGPELERIKKLIAELGVGVNISLPGKVSYDKIAEYFLAADLFVISSIYEGTCMVLHEAAICGLPVVATEFAGAVDYVEPGKNGYLTPIGDYRELAKKINLVLKNKEKAKEMGDFARNKVKKEFNRELALEKYQKMVEKLVAYNS